MTQDTSGEEFFEEKYRGAVDPWNFASSPHETAKYDQTIRALGGRHFKSAFEPGCSIGMLTQRLATVCDKVIATEISETALNEARRRCHSLQNVTFAHGSLDSYSTSDRFDLIMFSEIGYYFSEAQLSVIVDRLVHWLVPGGTLLAVHWLGVSEDHTISGDKVHEVLRSQKELSLQWQERHEMYRLDRLVRH